MKTKDYQIYVPCASVKYTNDGISITVFLSVKQAVFNVIRNHWNQIVLDTLQEIGVFAYREIYKKNMANQLVLHREISWANLHRSPSSESFDMYLTLKDLLHDINIVYKEEIKEELYKQIIEKV